MCFDPIIGFEDFLVLSANFSNEGLWSDGDFAANDEIDFSDFLLLSANLGESAPIQAILVPPPALGAIVFWGVGLLYGRRKFIA